MLKKIPFIILFCMLAFSNKLFAENWQYIETDSQNNFDIYILILTQYTMMERMVRFWKN